MSREEQDWHLARREPSNASGVGRYLEREDLSSRLTDRGGASAFALNEPKSFFDIVFILGIPATMVETRDRPTYNSHLFERLDKEDK